jgi:hypothetical protein
VGRETIDDRGLDRSRSSAFPNVRPCIRRIVVKVYRPLYRVFLCAVGTLVMETRSPRLQRRSPRY